MQDIDFRQFLLTHLQHPEFGEFALQATSDRNWVGKSIYSLRSHLQSINAAPERFAGLEAAIAHYKRGHHDTAI